MYSKLAVDVVLAVKNDDYNLDNIERINFSLTFNLKKIDECGLIDNVNFIIVDASAGVKVSSLIQIQKEYAANLTFIQLEGNPKNNNDFNVAEALNLGFNYGVGNFILFQSSDILISKNSWLNIFKFIRDLKKEDEIFISRRILISKKLYSKNPSFDDVDFYIENSFPKIEDISKTLGGAGVIGVNRMFFDKLKGFNEMMSGYGGTDIELLVECIKNTIPIDISIAAGVYAYKIPHHRIGTRHNIIKKYQDFSLIGNRNEKWGTNNEYTKINYINEINRNNCNKILTELNKYSYIDILKIYALFFHHIKLHDLYAAFDLFHTCKSGLYKNIVFYGSFPTHLQFISSLADPSINIFSDCIDGDVKNIFNLKMHLDRNFLYLYDNEGYSGASFLFYKKNIFKNKYILNRIKESKSLLVFNTLQDKIDFLESFPIPIENDFIFNDEDIIFIKKNYNFNIIVISIYISVYIVRIFKYLSPNFIINIFKKLI